MTSVQEYGEEEKVDAEEEQDVKGWRVKGSMGNEEYRMMNVELGMGEVKSLKCWKVKGSGLIGNSGPA